MVHTHIERVRERETWHHRAHTAMGFRCKKYRKYMEDGWKEPSNNKINPKRKNKFSVKKRIGKK